MEEEMEELCIEGLANHDDREPCAGAREGAGEASAAARAGQAIEPRNHRVRGADAVYGSGRQHRQRRYRESLAGPARSETLRMYGTSMRENREVPRSPAWPVTGRAAQGRPGRYA
jgi:hypothetical protein